MKNKMIKVVLFFTVSLAFFLLLPASAENNGESALRPKDNKISLDIKGMDIVDVLKMIAARAGLNIVVGKNVTGRVTLFLKDVDTWDAFELMLLGNDLAYEEKDGIFNVMTQRDYELIYGGRYRDKKKAKIIQLKYAKAQELSVALNQMKTSVGKIVVDAGSNTLALIDMPEKIKEMRAFIDSVDMPLETKVFSLDYAQAEKLSDKIKEISSKNIGSVRMDERTNRIVVTDYPDRIKDIEKIISAFDEKTPQVLIDAQIVEISPNKDEFSMGIDWDYWLKNNVRLIGNLAAPALSSAAVIPTKISLGVAAKGESVTKEGQYKSVVDALRVIGQTKILSSPRIMVLNNQEARILVGTKDAYITSSMSQGSSGQTVTAQSVNFVDTGIKLFVTPTVNRDGFVTMKIRPEISSATYKDIKSEDKETAIPIVTTSETETTIMIKDGTTIIIA
ncbi:MAG: secretin N-terminal domain-containing protein, partial [Candidatus Omnitrophota bacterium]